MSEAGDFIDAALQYEVSPYSYPDSDGDGLRRYGTSVGAIRGTVRDALKRYPAMSHDRVMVLSSELWTLPVYERRSAAIVLMQARVDLLVAHDLTRIEGFIRSAGSISLVDQLVADVLVPMLAGLDTASRARALVVIRRWSSEPDAALGAAAARILEPGVA
jgi:DNA alkylation repair enzyme